jgi:hypothetical protein
MKALLLAALVGGTIGVTAVPKDRAAIMYYTGRDSVISLVPAADSANLALILLTQWQGDTVRLSTLANRPCLGVALFSRGEWAALASAGKLPGDIRPRDAAWRIRIYPATRSAPIAIHDLATGHAYRAIGLEDATFRQFKESKGNEESPLKRPVGSRLATITGTCSAE